MKEHLYFKEHYSAKSYAIERIETVIKEFEDSKEYSNINDIIELFLVKSAIDQKTYEFTWNVDTYEQYRKKAKRVLKNIQHFFSKINEDNVSELYESIIIRYKDDFWKLIVYFKIYEKWSSITTILNNIPNALHSLMKQEKIVDRFGEEIVDFISNNLEYAKLIFECCLVKQDKNSLKTHIPKELDDRRIIKIIENYIDWERANANYLKIIVTLRKVNDTVISDKIRLKAKKKYKECMKRHTRSDNSAFVQTSISVELAEKCTDIVNDDDPYNHVITYDKGWIRDNLDYPTLLNNFIYVFEYTDWHFRCQFISNPRHFGIFESLFSGFTGVTEYQTGVAYRAEKALSALQMRAYINELIHNGIYIENIFKWFFEEYLCSEFNINGFKYITPSEKSSHLEKVLLILTQIESIIKQFRLYVQEGEIDRELFEFSSASDRITFTPSMIEKKYVYTDDENIKNIMYILFSEQSLLWLSDSTHKDGEYENLYQVLIYEKKRLQDFADYMLPQLNLLIDNHIVFENDGILAINGHKANVLLHMYKNGVVLYPYHKK